MPNEGFATRMARVLLAGEQDAGSIVPRVERALGQSGRWIAPLVQRYLLHYAGKTRPTRRAVARFLRDDRGFLNAQKKYGARLSTQPWFGGPAAMQPAVAASGWRIPSICTVGDLADWLRLDPEELAWFADRKLLCGISPSPLHHYHYKAVTKRSGDIRVIEVPKQKLRQIQRQVLSEVLNPIPVHDAVHGFRKGRNIQSFATPHTDRQVLVRMDIHDFFPTISAARVGAFFRTAGYPEPVANLLTGLCTNAVPKSAWRAILSDKEAVVSTYASAEIKTLYGRRHLPQGAPSSPALANLCAYRLDCRLQGLAAAAGATYTRYADDLAFSGDVGFARGADRFADHVGAILLEEGFRAHYRKTRIERPAVRQSLAGLVVNRHLNIPRRDFDELKAILTNCVRLGAESQNREAHPHWREHLNGRIGFVESVHAAKGARLRELFNRIRW
jgi:RNA-directed DNA polymerase